MQSLELKVNPTAAARAPVTRKVPVPKAASTLAQIAALVILVGLIVGSILFAVKVDSTAARMAAGAVFLLAALVLVAWASLALGTGIGPKQLLAVLKEFFGAISEAKAKEADDDKKASDEKKTDDDKLLPQPDTPVIPPK